MLFPHVLLPFRGPTCQQHFRLAVSRGDSLDHSCEASSFLGEADNFYVRINAHVLSAVAVIADNELAFF